MGGVGDELAAHPLLLLEGGRHLVEGVGQRGDLLRALAWHARVVVAVGDAPGGLADLLEWTRQHPGDDHGQPDSERHGEHDSRHQDAAHGLVEHRLGGLRGLAVGHHQGRERVGAEDRHAQGEHGHRDTGRDQGRQGDANGQAAPRAPAHPDRGATDTGAAR